jgi:hypothetical protein
MNSPIKIIYKYKNDNRKTQYQYYIFLGSLLSPTLLKIINKIEDLNFYDTIIGLPDKEIKILEDFYGIYWYKYFFLTDHINYSIETIINSSQKRTDIIKKYNNEWYILHIDKFKYYSKSKYSYNAIFKKNSTFKHKKITEYDDNDLEIDDNNYKLNNNNNNNNRLYNKFVLDGGNDFNVLEDEYDIDDYDDDLINKTDDDLINKTDDDTFEGDEIDIGNIYYNDIKIDENSDIIKYKLENIFEKTKSNISDKMNKMTVFNADKNKVVYDDILHKVYIKNYIFNQYIYDTDTIKTIKQKICYSIQMDLKFNKNSPYIIPSRMYLWSDYVYEDVKNNKVYYKKDSIMLGQKWIKRNELLGIDVVPNDNLYLYEKLKGTLKLLKDNINKYGSKIKREDYENDILYDYNEFYINNEIYMMDIYNNIGTNYKVSSEELKNIYDVYVRIYYYNITQDEFKNIIDYVGSNNELKKNEENKIVSVYKNITNDLILEGEITRTIEKVKIDKLDYKSILKNNYITQAVIHINLEYESLNLNKLDIRNLFDSFKSNDMYPFIQYQSNNNKLLIKFNNINQETDKQAILSKWFENSPYGINFKIKVEQKGNSENKYIAVTLYETGRLEYKIQWKENDKAVIDDILKTYDNIRNLIKKINNECGKVKIYEPQDIQFKYAFINTIQHFELPKKFIINHNDLSDFARYFFPYISIVIDPRKRLSKNIEKNDKSKYGTYLRYKRISKYDNDAKIENRIIYFLRNYEFIPNQLAIEISKQFNITEENAIKIIEEIILKYPLLKKSRKILKKLDNIPKFKPPGIGIDIQGRSKENYKISIRGARYKQQLDDILDFMAILLYLYTDTYLIKNPERLVLKEKLKQLTNIAKRRFQVDDVVISSNDNNIKDITKLDKDRLGYKPGKGESQWSRYCQNSGTKNRRPHLYTDDNIQEMIKTGYIYNSKTDEYEKKITVKGKDIILKAAKLSGQQSLYYTCNPDINNKYMYIGFLSRSINPNGLCMPCCYKKDPGISNNKQKQNYHLKCLGKINETSVDNNLSDKLYILQDTNKMLTGRYGYLSKYLDYFFNILLKKTTVIKNNYMVYSKTGYFMKYGCSQDNIPYLQAIASCLNMSYDDIINKIIKHIKNDQYFIYANSGDIKTQFQTSDKFIDVLKKNVEIMLTLSLIHI